MKLCLVTETYPPEVNGVAMTLSRLVGGLAARGHTIDIVRPRQRVELRGGGGEGAGSIVARPRPAGVTELLVPGMPIPFYPSLRMGLPVSARLRRRWQATPPDVVHVATEGPLGWSALRTAQAAGLPVTSTFHTNFHAYGGHYGMRFIQRRVLAYLRWFHNRTRVTLAPTAQMCAELAAAGFERTGVLARGVDARLFDPARRSAELRRTWGVADETTPVFIYVGRLAAEKNLQLAVDAFLAAERRLPGARFVLVGDGPERAALQAQHPHFHFAGTRRGEDLAAHYASADLFFFPSVTETFGNVVTEALASGLVVLAYDYAAAREHLREGVNGFLAPFDDRAAFLAAAERIAAAPESWPSVRRAARATALDLTWDKIFDTFETALRTAAQPSR